MKKLLLITTAIVSASLLLSSAAIAMPAIIIPGLLAGGFAFATGATLIGLTGFAAAFAIGLSTIALGFISQALAPKAPGSDFGQEGQGRNRQIRQPITTRKIIYGEQRVSGPIVLAEVTENNDFLHIIILLASHEVEEISYVLLNEIPIYDSQLSTDSGEEEGTVITGQFRGKLRIRKFLGTDDQTADPDLVSEVENWTTDHRLRGIAYIYLRLQFDRDVYTTGIPNISAQVKGKKVKEIRESALPIDFHHNPALCIRDYLTTIETSAGLGISEDEIDDTSFITAANTCEEVVETNGVLGHSILSVDTAADTLVVTDETLNLQLGDRITLTGTTLPAGTSVTMYVIPLARIKVINVANDDDDPEEITLFPRVQLATSYENAIAGVQVNITTEGSNDLTITSSGEPRYTLNGVIDSKDSPRNILDSLLSSCGGRLIYTGGLWRLYAAEYFVPTVTFDEDDIIGPIDVQTRHSRRIRFNAVKGTFISPVNNGVIKDYPPVTNSFYEGEDDNKRLYRDFDLPYTSRAATAQRLAKILLERHRQQITVGLQVTLRKGMLTEAGRVVNITISRFGWSSKPFEIIDWEMVTNDQDDAPLLTVQLTLRETASAVFDWNSGEETQFDLAPNTNLSNPFFVGVPTGLTLSTSNIVDDSTGINYGVNVNWNRHVDPFVREGGFIEVQMIETLTFIDLTTGANDWIASSKGTDEYYLTTSIYSEPSVVEHNGSPMTRGGFGSLAADEFSYGDNDLLGFDVIYVRLTDGSDPDDSANTIEAKIFDTVALVAGNETRALIRTVELGTAYDVRIRAINYLGVKSKWVIQENYSINDPLVGLTGGSNDWGFVWQSVTSSEDWELVSDSVTSNEDWGGVAD